MKTRLQMNSSRSGRLAGHCSDELTGKASAPRRKRGRLLGLGLAVLLAAPLLNAASENWIHEHGDAGDFPLVWEGNAAEILIAPDDFKVVAIAANDLAADVGRVTGHPLAVATTPSPGSEQLVILGTLGRNPIIDALAAMGKIDVGAIRGEWESFLITTADVPAELIATGSGTPDASRQRGPRGEPRGASGSTLRALLIVGSDRRGTAFGAYELSQAIGVSPWHWWADVAPSRKSELHVAAGTRRFGPPSVQYRGIFINDEDWGLQPWAAKTFAPEEGGIGPKTYAKVFELLLRLKANTLWPAMHKCTQPFNRFAANAPLADDYAIVMGSSHAEPMLRNNVGEWTAPPEEYNYVSNRAGVRDYWEERLRTNGQYENVYTVGMRGIHDSNMQGPTTDAGRIQALETVFADQRDLLAKRVQPAIDQIPQMFCAYKEVLDLYRAGLRVPDDVTIVWPDDNFGYVRNFASAAERKRSGGFGVYYHLSYLGRPLSYLWLSTTSPALIWSEMSKAYDHGAQRMWIANVGDIKPAELATEFFLQMAWDIGRWQRENVAEFLREWAAREFGPTHAADLAAIMADYFRLNASRKPEHLQWWRPGTPPTASPLSPEETRARLAAWAGLSARVDCVGRALPEEKQDAFFELVAYPVRGAALANQRYFCGEQAARPGNEPTWADRARAADRELRELTRRFNEEIAGGKWHGIMALEPADDDWKSMRIAPWAIPAFADLPQTGGAAQSAVRPDQMEHAGETRVARGLAATAPGFVGAQFVEAGGVVSINARHATARVANARGDAWQNIPGLGREADVVGVFPTTMPAIAVAAATTDAPRLEYRVEFLATGNLPVYLYLLPTHPLDGGGELSLAIALDDEPAKLVALAIDDGGPGWSQGVLDGVRVVTTSLRVLAAGRHTIRIFGTNPGVMIEKLVIDCGGLTPSYFGPAETAKSERVNSPENPSR